MTTLNETNENEIRELLVGRKVTKVADDRLELDDGTVLHLEGNDGCGGCSAGWYALTELNGVDNVITNVELEYQALGKYEEDGVYRIFVFADNQKVNLATFTGGDGSGYYGTGYTIKVTLP